MSDLENQLGILSLYISNCSQIGSKEWGEGEHRRALRIQTVGYKQQKLSLADVSRERLFVFPRISEIVEKQARKTGESTAQSMQQKGSCHLLALHAGHHSSHYCCFSFKQETAISATTRIILPCPGFNI